MTTVTNCACIWQVLGVQVRPHQAPPALPPLSLSEPAPQGLLAQPSDPPPDPPPLLQVSFGAWWGMPVALVKTTSVPSEDYCVMLLHSAVHACMRVCLLSDL